MRHAAAALHGHHPHFVHKQNICCAGQLKLVKIKISYTEPNSYGNSPSWLEVALVLDISEDAGPSSSSPELLLSDSVEIAAIARNDNVYV